VEFRNSGQSPRIPETPDSLRGFRKLRTRLQKLRKGSGVDGKARGSREEWKWIGSPLTDPFLWPKLANVNDFRAMIRHGNHRPAPGPDRWEKWLIKNLSDNVLSLVMDLLNFMVIHSDFPGNIKDMWLTMFHKRGIRTNLTNWRGLMISNFMANAPMTWLNFLLVPYAACKSLIPETQVATQQGVQTRDMMSYLSAVKSFPNHHKQTVYALQRDQMKGFDYLHTQGFYDAIITYSLPRRS
jgi:hypothetical protein